MDPFDSAWWEGSCGESARWKARKCPSRIQELLAIDQNITKRIMFAEPIN
jgi:hypothetical protein